MSEPSSSKPIDKPVSDSVKDETAQPGLGVLEEDDEFEEFEVTGASCLRSPSNCT